MGPYCKGISNYLPFNQKKSRPFYTEPIFFMAESGMETHGVQQVTSAQKIKGLFGGTPGWLGFWDES